MPTVSSWPGVNATNPYIRLYYDALGRHGIVLGPTLEFDDRFLRDTPDLDAIHIHWGLEHIWRTRGETALSRIRGLAGFWRYLRLARSIGIRVIWTLHDVDHHEGSGFIDRVGYRLLAAHADLCIVHDVWAADQFVRRFHGSRDAVMVLPHGNYDGAFPTARQRGDTLARLGVPDAAKVLLCQGAVRPYKQYELAIEAVGGLGPEYHLIVAGDPLVAEYADRLKRAASGRDNVHLVLERQTDQGVSDLFAASDCVLLPYAKITGSGSLLTAATLGRGVVASDLPYFRRVVAAEADAAVFVEPGSAEALRQGIEQFFRGSHVHRHLAARRLADAVPWERVVEPVVAWCESQCGERGDRSQGRIRRMPRSGSLN